MDTKPVTKPLIPSKPKKRTYSSLIDKCFASAEEEDEDNTLSVNKNPNKKDKKETSY
jgi:hypothetical protein